MTIAVGHSLEFYVSNRSRRAFSLIFKGVQLPGYHLTGYSYCPVTTQVRGSHLGGLGQITVDEIGWIG